VCSYALTDLSLTSSLNLVQVPADNSYSSQQLAFSSGFYLVPSNVIPDGQGGILSSVNMTSTPQVPEVIHWTPQGATNFATNVLYSDMVLGDNGTAFGTDTDSLTSFDMSSGHENWTYQAPRFAAIIASATNGGLIGRITNSNLDDVVMRFDLSGTPTTDTWNTQNTQYYLDNQWLGFRDVAQPAIVTAFSAAPVQFSSSVWFTSENGGSQAATKNITVTGFSNQGANQATIKSDLQKILAALPSNTSCKNWLQGGGSTGSQVIQSLIDSNNFGHAVFNDPFVGAFTGSTNRGGAPTGVPSDSTFTVNDNGGFFNARDTNGNQWLVGVRKYVGGSLKAQATILIHELGHVMTITGFQEDAGIPKAGKANDKLVDQNCRSLIEGLQ
jgi:hypothetical protein